MTPPTPTSSPNTTCLTEADFETRRVPTELGSDMVCAAPFLEVGLADLGPVTHAATESWWLIQVIPSVLTARFGV